MSRRLHVPAFFTIAVGLALPAGPRTRAQDMGRAATTAVSVVATVSDRRHVPVGDLASAEFVVKEDGRDRTLTAGLVQTEVQQVAADLLSQYEINYARPVGGDPTRAPAGR